MMKKIFFVLFITLISARSHAAAYSAWTCGPITAYTSTSAGLMIMISGGVPGLPTNCTGSPWGWMLIPESNKTMVAVALAGILTNHSAYCIYTNATPAGSYCVVNQVAP